MSERSMTEARLSAPPSAANIEYITKPELVDEVHTLPEAIHIDLAHLVMLVERGVVSTRDGAALARALMEIERRGEEAVPIEPKRGSLLLQIEHALAGSVGEDVAGRLHTGRSRNDWSGAISRLYARNRILELIDELDAVQASLLELAEQHVESYMPGYTHLQHAQPITLGHFLLRFYFTFERDLQRLESAFERSNLSALGGAALAGTSWPLDRQRVADLLGHEGLVDNAIDAGVFSRDYPMENAAVLSILMTNVGQLAADLYLWSTWEFGFVEIADELAGTSSIMPQKKNPHVFERIRGLTGRAAGWLPAVMGMTRSSSSSDLDLYWGGEIMPVSCRETYWVLKLLQAGLLGTTFHTDVMAERAAVNWSTATYLADEVVRATGLSFREAHQVVGRFVRLLVAAGVAAEEATGAVLDQAAEEIMGRPLALGDEFVRRSLRLEPAVAALVTDGSAHPDAVRASVRRGAALHEEHLSWLSAKRELLAHARKQLDDALATVAGAVEAST